MVKPDLSATAGGVVAAARPSKATTETLQLSDISTKDPARPHGSSAIKTRGGGGVGDVSLAGSSPPNKAKKSNDSPEKKERIPWSAEEDSILRQLAEERDKDTEPNRSSKRLTWSTIAARFSNPTRTADQCYERWAKVLKPDLKKTAWTKEEDELLLKAHEALKNEKQMENKWSSIAKRIGGRSGKQVRERWINHLNPKIKTGPWTMEEDEILLRAHLVEKKNWSDMTELLASEDKEGRPANALKNRFNTSIKPAIRDTNDYAVALDLLRAARQLESQFAASGGKRPRQRDNTVKESIRSAASSSLPQVMSSSSGSTEMSSGSSASELEAAGSQSKGETKAAALTHPTESLDIHKNNRNEKTSMVEAPFVPVTNTVKEEKVVAKGPSVLSAAGADAAVQQSPSKKNEVALTKKDIACEAPQSIDAHAPTSVAPEVVDISKKNGTTPAPKNEIKLMKTSAKEQSVPSSVQQAIKNKTNSEQLIAEDASVRAPIVSAPKKSEASEKGPVIGNITQSSASAPSKSSSRKSDVTRTQTDVRPVATRTPLPELRKREAAVPSQEMGKSGAKAVKLQSSKEPAVQPLYEESPHTTVQVPSSASGERKDTLESSPQNDTVPDTQPRKLEGTVSESNEALESSSHNDTIPHTLPRKLEETASSHNNGSVEPRTTMSSRLESSSPTPQINAVAPAPIAQPKAQGLELLTMALERGGYQSDLDRATATPPPQVVQTTAAFISPQIAYALPQSQQQVQYLIIPLPVGPGGAPALNTSYYPGQAMVFTAPPQFATAYSGMSAVPLQTFQIPPGASIGQVPMMASRVVMDPSASNKRPAGDDSYRAEMKRTHSGAE